MGLDDIPMVSTARRFLVFRLDHQRYALPLTTVERVLRAVAVTPLPDAPPVVLGAVNIHGDVFPVLNVRHRCSLPARPPALADAFVLIRTAARPVLIVVDAIDGIIEPSEAEVVAVERIAPAPGCVPSLITLEDGLVLIQDADRFLSIDDELALNDALHDAPGI